MSIFHKHFTYVSGGTGTPTDTRSLDVDGSTTPAIFEVSYSQDVFVQAVHLVIHDFDVDGDDFGAIVGALTNGLLLEVKDQNDAIIGSIHGDVPFQQNRDFFVFGESGTINLEHDIINIQFKWNPPWILQDKHRISMTIQDDLTALAQFRAGVVATS